MAGVWVRKPTTTEIAQFSEYKTWSKEPSTWQGSKQENDETFFVLQGRAYVELADGTRFRFEKGDLVTLPAHEDKAWTWYVTEPFQKQYIFTKRGQ